MTTFQRIHRNESKERSNSSASASIPSVSSNGAAEDSNSSPSGLKQPSNGLTAAQKKRAARRRKKKNSSDKATDSTKQSSKPVQLSLSPRSTDISRDIAVAAKVDWGGEEPTPRMIELQKRHCRIVDIAEAGILSLHDIKDHNEYLAVLTKNIADEGEQMKRKFRIATAKQSRSHDMKRASLHQAQASAIMRRQERYNNEVAMAQCEVDWLRNSPAYTQAMEFLDEHWVKTAKGDYVSKKDLHDDMNVSFDELLLTMKTDNAQQHSSKKT